MTAATATSHSSIWIRNPAYDLSLVMGGAILTLGIAGTVTIHPALLPIFFWIWVIGFEGSHFWATFSRTYIDRAFRQENSLVLNRSLIFFVLPIAAVIADKGLSTTLSTTIYGFFIFLWSLYHNARQHFGFVSIYVKKSGMEQSLSNRYRTLIYWAVGATQVYFALNFKTQVAFAGAPKPDEISPLVGLVLAYGPMTVSVLAGLYLFNLATKTYASYGKKALVPALYVATCLIFYSTMFYVIAPREPFFSAHANGAQLFMLIAIMNSLFHNIQYHAIVWHYANRRYTQEQQAKGVYGLAQWVNGRAATYILVALLLGAVFGAIVWNMGDWPSWTGNFVASPFNAIAYILYFGIVGHHFYLDQYIWRPSRQPELRQYLNLRPQAIV